MTIKPLVVLVFTLAVFQPNLAKAIINGSECSQQQFPASMALIRYFNGGKYKQICGATLIAPDIALTAAHCIDDFIKSPQNETPNFQYFVSSKSDLRNLHASEFTTSNHDTIAVRSIMMHGGYTDINQTPTHDVALLILSRSSKVNPAEIITPQLTQSLSRGRSVYIVGWGQQLIGQNGSLPSIPVKNCASTFLNSISTHEIQLGSNEYTSRTCFGDSGGAAYAQFEPTYIGTSTRYHLIGVTSHTTNHDSDCSKGGVDLRVDTYYDWIVQVSKQACQDKVRPTCRG